MYVVHEGHVRCRGWLLGVGDGDDSQDVVPEVAQAGQPVDACLPLPGLGVAGGGADWGVGHVGLVVAVAAIIFHPAWHGVSHKVSPPVDGGHPNSAPREGRALAVRGGERGAVVSGDVEKGVEEKVSNALPQGGRLDQGGRRDAFGGAGGVEA